MKMNSITNNAGKVLTLDEYRILHTPLVRATPTSESDDFLVRSPAQPQVLVIKSKAHSITSRAKRTKRSHAVSDH